MIGFSKSASCMPVARHKERAPAMLRPAVEVRLRYPFIAVMSEAYPTPFVAQYASETRACCVFSNAEERLSIGELSVREGALEPSTRQHGSKRSALAGTDRGRAGPETRERTSYSAPAFSRNTAPANAISSNVDEIASRASRTNSAVAHSSPPVPSMPSEI